MKIDPRFPITGWHFAGSDSHGAAELYRNIPRVVVKLFPEEESRSAKRTYEFLMEKGLQTADIEKVTQRDQKLYFYVRWSGLMRQPEGWNKQCPSVVVAAGLRCRFSVGKGSQSTPHSGSVCQETNGDGLRCTTGTSWSDPGPTLSRFHSLSDKSARISGCARAAR